MAGANGQDEAICASSESPIARLTRKAKVTGQTKYADDLVFPRMLHTKILRSTVPHARILKIDTSKAESYPGVKVVLTRKRPADSLRRSTGQRG